MYFACKNTPRPEQFLDSLNRLFDQGTSMPVELELAKKTETHLRNNAEALCEKYGIEPDTEYSSEDFKKLISSYELSVWNMGRVRKHFLHVPFFTKRFSDYDDFIGCEPYDTGFERNAALRDFYTNSAKNRQI